MDYACVLLLTSVLLIRPSEFVPGLIGAPVYLVTLIASLIVGWYHVLGGLAPADQRNTQVTKCLLAFMGLSIASNVIRGDLATGYDTAMECLRNLLYVLLVLGTVTTTGRFFGYIVCIVLSGSFVTAAAILNYRGIFPIAGFTVVEEGDGLRRLGSTGLFGDPNDMGLQITQTMILAAMLCCSRQTSIFMRVVSVVCIALLGYGLQLTYSRGSLLGLMAGVGTGLIVVKGKRSIPFFLLLLPIVLVVFGGRQASIIEAAASGSGQSRIHLWDAYLGLFVQNPILGIGAGAWSVYAAQVAHNSFLHALAEVGVCGATAFVAICLACVTGVLRCKPVRGGVVEPRLSQARPFMVAMLTSYLMGMMTLTRVYVIATYIAVALAGSFIGVCERYSESPQSTSIRHLGRWSFMITILFAALLWVYVKRSASYY